MISNFPRNVQNIKIITKRDTKLFDRWPEQSSFKKKATCLQDVSNQVKKMGGSRFKSPKLAPKDQATDKGLDSPAQESSKVVKKVWTDSKSNLNRSALPEGSRSREKRF